MNWQSGCAVLALVAGCAAVTDRANKDTGPTQIQPVLKVEDSDGVAEAANASEQNTEANTETAAGGTAKTGTLGQTVATLGNAREPGLWLKTPLVTIEQKGRVSFGGQSVTVQLIPIDGPPTAGSRISLQAMQALRAPLTGFIEINVVAL